jgi:hypothetical protein
MSQFIISILVVGGIFFGPIILCFIFNIKEARIGRGRHTVNSQIKKNKAFHYGQSHSSGSEFNKRKPFSYTGNRSGKYTGKYYG